MISTRVDLTESTVLGVDLTDRFAKKTRAIDVCGLDDDLKATFWTWEWTQGGGELELDGVLSEISAARCVMIDGPQALAQLGFDRRICERQTNAPGRTPDVLDPTDTKPFAGFVRSGVQLFAALYQAGIPISAADAGYSTGANEVFPGSAFAHLAGPGTRLAKKSSVEGRQSRADLLCAAGVQFPTFELHSHDQLDACLAALIGAAACGMVAGWGVEGIGDPIQVDSEGRLREGPMVGLVRQ